MGLVGDLAGLVLRLFALGLFASWFLDLVLSRPPGRLRRLLSGFYAPFLDPIRRVIRPVRILPGSVAVDFSPLILILFIWLVLHPFLEWVFKGI